MTTKNHYELAIYLIRNYIHFDSEPANMAFIFGCIEPDLNIATYLKGSLSCQPLRGHHYPNMIPSIQSLLKKLQCSENRGFLYYYRIGKLVHYLTDAFTYPHNPVFRGNLLEHIRYEKDLGNRFSTVLSTWYAQPKVYDIDNLYPYFTAMHDEYLKQQLKAAVDISFILDVIPTVLKSLYTITPVTCLMGGGNI